MAICRFIKYSLPVDVTFSCWHENFTRTARNPVLQPCTAPDATAHWIKSWVQITNGAVACPRGSYLTQSPSIRKVQRGHEKDCFWLHLP